MPEVSQADFTRAARGATPGGAPSAIEDFVMGISSVARAAVRRVHNQTPAIATAYFARKVGYYLYQGGSAAATARSYGSSLDRYIAWGAQAGAADLDVKDTVSFTASDAVRARAHVVLDHGSGGREARVLLWDELPLNTRAAEMIALPALECVDGAFGAGATTSVAVWQLAQGQQETVLPAAAQARRADVRTLLQQF